MKATNHPTLIDMLTTLTGSDHFYYMSTKYWNDGDDHKYFSHYKTPYDACINYMNTLTDLETRRSGTRAGYFIIAAVDETEERLTYN